MTTPHITFIGAGNMATAIIGGLTRQGFDASKITASDPFDESLQRLAEATAVNTTSDNLQAIANAEVIVLAVKPQMMKSVACGLADALQDRSPLIISIAAGIEVSSLQQWLGDHLPVIRCMPNTPALLLEGATGIFANNATSPKQKALAETIISAFGLAIWVEDEKQLDAVTALSGSGPAYFFLLIEAMQATGEKLGLPAETASKLTLQTAIGAARMARESDVDAAELRRRVTSPNGTTEAAINTFEAGGFRELCESALMAAERRSEELAKLFE